MNMLCQATAAIFIVGILIAAIVVGLAGNFPSLSLGCV